MVYGARPYVAWLVATVCVVAAAQVPGASAGYIVQSTTVMPWGTAQTLAWTGSHPPQFASFGTPISPLDVRVYRQAQGYLRVQITDPNDPDRWQVPGIVPPPNPDSTVAASASAYSYAMSAVGQAFRLTVKRTSSPAATIFDTGGPAAGPQLFFADQFIALGSATAPSSHIAGLGERRFSFWLHQPGDPWREFSFFAADQGTPPEKGLYGSHPFYLDYRPPSSSSSASASGAFMLNSNAMQVNLGAQNVTFMTTGGIVDLFVFAGPTPSEVTRQYHSVIGLPAIPPYWALGFHQCRWGYKELSDVRKIVDGFEGAHIPLDTVWMDIDYMDDFKVFTVDPVHFPAPQFGSFVEGLLGTDRHFVPIVDPGVKIEAGYSTYLQGLDDNVYIQFGATAARGDAPTSSVVGKVWPKLVNYPDWTHPNTTEYWSSQIAAFRDVIKFSGLWIDMNEPSSFCDGRCSLVPDNDPNRFGCYCPDPQEVSSLNTPPFLPGGADARACRVQAIYDSGGGLDCGTISMTTEQHGGLHYNLHNLFGHLESVATAAALTAATGGERPFVITRSTFPGTGAHVGHWLGDNDSTFDQLKSSISGLVTMNMFGIPLVGADICGFAGETTEELCIRWMQMGAFYPFSRNHNVEDSNVPQEPFSMGPRLAAASRASLGLRYSLLPYLNTLFWRAHVAGGMVAQPALFAFPSDAAAVVGPHAALPWWLDALTPSVCVLQASVDTQFMLGPSLMVSPVLSAGARSVPAYFPPAQWYNVSTGAALGVCNVAGECMDAAQRTLTLDAPLDVINVHVRGGSILPRQGRDSMTTASARQQPVDLLVSLAWSPAQAGDAASAYGGIEASSGGGDPSMGRLAAGELYMDDGVTLNTGEAYTHVVYTARATHGDSFALTNQVVHDSPSGSFRDVTIGAVEVFGTRCAVIHVTLSTTDASGATVSVKLPFVQHNRLNTLRADFPASVPALGQAFEVTFLCATDVPISVWVWLAPLLAFTVFVTGVVWCWCRKDKQTPSSLQYFEQLRASGRFDGSPRSPSVGNGDIELAGAAASPRT